MGNLMGNKNVTGTFSFFFLLQEPKTSGLVCSSITSVPRNMLQPALQMLWSPSHHLHECDIPEEICLSSGVRWGNGNPGREVSVQPAHPHQWSQEKWRQKGVEKNLLPLLKAVLLAKGQNMHSIYNAGFSSGYNAIHYYRQLPINHRS